MCVCVRVCVCVTVCVMLVMMLAVLLPSSCDYIKSGNVPGCHDQLENRDNLLHEGDGKSHHGQNDEHSYIIPK